MGFEERKLLQALSRRAASLGTAALAAWTTAPTEGAWHGSVGWLHQKIGLPAAAIAFLLLQACQSAPPASPARSAAPESAAVPIKLIPLAPLPEAGIRFSQAAMAKPMAKPMASQPANPAVSSAAPAAPVVTPDALDYRIFDLPTSQVHLVRIPPNTDLRLSVALSTGLTPLEDLAQMVPGAMAAINAGFFDPNNARSMNFITQNGVKTADPTDNQLLMSNKGIQPYLSKVLNRSEFRHYRCGESEAETSRYEIGFRQAPVPTGCRLADSVGGGPQLLPRITATEEAFWAEEKGRVLRDAIGMQRPNARSAIALTSKGEILLAVAAQKPPTSKLDSPQVSLLSAGTLPNAQPATSPSSGLGLSLADFASFLQGQGAVQALNLDGGSSSGLYVAPRTIYGKRDASGQPIRRAVKSVLVVSPKSGI